MRVFPPRQVEYPLNVSDFPFRRGDGSPIVVAHRGVPPRALENSLASFSLALADGADMIEFDVRLSADGEPVVIHDARTGRTARQNVRVSRCSGARLARIRLKNGEPVPLLGDVLELVRGAVPINIESKTPGATAAACRVLAASGYAGPVLLSSRLRGECLVARALRPDLPCGLVTRRPSASDLAFCRRHGLASIHPAHRVLTVLRLRKVAAAGIALVPYTVDDERRFFRLVDAGAAGVISNRSRELRAAWDARRRNGA